MSLSSSSSSMTMLSSSSSSSSMTMLSSSSSSLLLLLMMLLMFTGHVCHAAAAAAASAETTAADPVVTTASSITVLGLGKMGTAVAECLAKEQSEPSSSTSSTTSSTTMVHVWNRGIAKRDALQKTSNHRITVHETPYAAVQASNITLILIDDWEGTVALLTDIVAHASFASSHTTSTASTTSTTRTASTTNEDADERMWNHDKTIVVFSTYTPTDIQVLQHQFFSTSPSNTTTTTNTVLVGGAIVGVPQTICTPKALILTSSSSRSRSRSSRRSSDADATTTDTAMASIQSLGSVISLPGNDVGHASLVNMALIMVITFGIAGQELAHLMIQQYHSMQRRTKQEHSMAHHNRDNNDHDDDNDMLQQFWDIYATVSLDIGPTYTKMLLPIVHRAITTGQYDQHRYVPVRVFQRVLQSMVTFLHTDLHIRNTSTLFLTSYVTSLQQVSNDTHGPAAWIEAYKTTRVPGVADDEKESSSHPEELKKNEETTTATTSSSTSQEL